MMTVRFPNGFSVQYNDANHVMHGANDNILRTSEGGKFIAVVPKEAIVEAVRPCRMYSAADEDRAAQILAATTKELQLLKRAIAKLTKGK